MKKTIYLVHDEPRRNGDSFETCPTFDREEAIRIARTAWNHLTTSEKKQREVYVGVHTVNVPDDDQRPAEQVYHDLMDEDEWPCDHDVIEVVS